MALSWLLHRKTDLTHQTERIESPPNLLSDVKLNSSARISGFASTLPADRRAHLQAYGIIPGNLLQVRQSRPVTIVQVEHTELALETDLAALIYVEPQ